jgi:hypothetical protein
MMPTNHPPGGTSGKGSVLRVKQGYNPNSSSMGSIIFALPVSLVAIAFGLAAVSGFILPHFIRQIERSVDPEAPVQRERPK